MKTEHLTVTEAALLLHGLRSVFVLEDEALRERLMHQLEDELAMRGLKLAPPDEEEELQGINYRLRRNQPA